MWKGWPPGAEDTRTPRARTTGLPRRGPPLEASSWRGSQRLGGFGSVRTRSAAARSACEVRVLAGVRGLAGGGGVAAGAAGRALGGDLREEGARRRVSPGVRQARLKAQPMGGGGWAAGGGDWLARAS